MDTAKDVIDEIYQLLEHPMSSPQTDHPSGRVSQGYEIDGKWYRISVDPLPDPDRVILEFSNRGGEGNPDVWYCEGNSPVVHAKDLRLYGHGSGWFTFEEPFVTCVVELFKLGFTMPEVYKAWEDGVGLETEEA